MTAEIRRWVRRTAVALAAGTATAAGGSVALADDAPPPNDVQVQVEIPITGGLGISIAATGVTLDAPERADERAPWRAVGELPLVTVVDLRATNPGWNVTAWPTGFDGPQEVGAAALAWQPRIVSTSPGQQVVAGDPTTAGEVEVSTLGVAAPGGGRGTTVLGAALTVELPGDALPGTYRTSLCLTVI